jgi:putative membrane protein
MSQPTRLQRLPWLFVGASILAQITWILVPAGDRGTVTTAVVLLFTAASVSHAWTRFGGRWTAAFAAISCGFGLGIELLGSRTGWPFGEYFYTSQLQPQILGVPMIVPLAWLMMAYPSLLLARSLTTRWVVPLAAVGLTTWDFFLDPQMVGEGYWVWQDPEPALPGIPGIPLQNYGGWLIGTLVLMWLLNRLPRHDVDLGVPLVLYIWMWVGGVVANAVFLSRPGVAAVGGLGMAVLGAPAAVRWRRR